MKSCPLQDSLPFPVKEQQYGNLMPLYQHSFQYYEKSFSKFARVVMVKKLSSLAVLKMF
jgi:hypothetical protein